ncbi:MAG: phosphatase PAP2 family protein [Methyloligellaceae bacterium]
MSPDPKKAEIRNRRVKGAGSINGACLPKPVWRVRPLIASHLVAIIILASWLLPVSRSWWDQLDVAVFRLLNGSLRLGEWWQMLWALANHRLSDVLSAMLILLLILSWLWGRPRDIQNLKCAAFGAFALFAGAVLLLLHPVIRRGFDYTRPGPSLVVDEALRLTTLVPSIDAKDADRSSFLGDHAFILITIALFFIYLGPRRFAIAASILAFIFTMPRLVGGAHWLTDDVIGGVVPALLVVSWLLATPLGYYMAKKFLPLVKFIVALIPERLRIPERTVS